MKKSIIFVGVFLLACVILLIFIKPFSEKKNTKIVEKIVKVSDKIVKKYKIAELSNPEEKTNGQETIEGKVVIIPNNPKDIYSKMMVAVKKDNEFIVTTNPEYVRTLGYLYFDKDVRLKGKWQKDAIIYGKKYKVFRVEDISLAQK